MIDRALARDSRSHARARGGCAAFTGIVLVIHLEMGRASFASARRDDPLSLSVPPSSQRAPISAELLRLYGRESRDYRSGAAVVLFIKLASIATMTCATMRLL